LIDIALSLKVQCNSAAKNNAKSINCLQHDYNRVL
jgi:hypothetical protein